MSQPSKPFVGAARTYTDAQLGGPTTEIETVVSVGTAATQLAKNNPDRVGLVIVNLSTNIVYCAWNSAVSSSQGILLSASGGNFALNVRDDFTLPSRELSALAGGPGSNVYVLEIVRFSYSNPETLK